MDIMIYIYIFNIDEDEDKIEDVGYIYNQPYEILMRVISIRYYNADIEPTFTNSIRFGFIRKWCINPSYGPILLEK